MFNSPTMTWLARERKSIKVDRPEISDSHRLADKLTEYVAKHNLSSFQLKTDGKDVQLLPLRVGQGEKLRLFVGEEEANFLFMGQEETYQVFFGKVDRKSHNPGYYNQCKRKIIIALVPERMPVKTEKLTSEFLNRLEIDFTWGESYDGGWGFSGEECLAKLFGGSLFLEDFLHQLL